MIISNTQPPHSLAEVFSSDWYALQTLTIAQRYGLIPAIIPQFPSCRNRPNVLK